MKDKYLPGILILIGLVISTPAPADMLETTTGLVIREIHSQWVMPCNPTAEEAWAASLICSAINTFCRG